MRLTERLLRVMPLSLLTFLGLWAAGHDNDDPCGNVGECLGQPLDDLLVVVVATLLGAGLLRLTRTPRVLAHVAALLLAGGCLWYAAHELALALDPAGGATRPPVLAALSIGVLTGLAATYAVGPGGRPVPRLVVVSLPLLLAVGCHLAAERVAADREAAQLAAAPVTLYAPVIEGHDPERAAVVDGAVHLSWSLEIDGRSTFIDVDLVPAPHEEELQEDQIAVERDDTVLIADFDRELLDEGEVRAALEEAPVVAPGDLAG